MSVCRTWKQPSCLSTEEWIKEDVVHIIVEYYSAMRGNEIVPFTETCTCLIWSCWPPTKNLQWHVGFVYVVKSLLVVSSSMDCSTPGLLVPHCFPEFAQIHVHWIADAIQPSYPLLPSSSFAFNLSQHQNLFPMNQLFIPGGQSIGASASVLRMNIQDWFPLGLTGLISLQSKGLSRVFSSTTVRKHQFFGAQPSLWSDSHIHPWLLERP